MKLSRAFPLFSFPLALVVAIPMPPVIGPPYIAGTSSKTTVPHSRAQPQSTWGITYLPQQQVQPYHYGVEPFAHDQFPPNDISWPDDPFDQIIPQKNKLSHTATPFQPSAGVLRPGPGKLSHTAVPYRPSAGQPYVAGPGPQNTLVAQPHRPPADMQAGHPVVLSPALRSRPSLLIKPGMVVSLQSNNGYGYPLDGYGDILFNTVVVVKEPSGRHNMFWVAETYSIDKRGWNILPAWQYCTIMTTRLVRIDKLYEADPLLMVENPHYASAKFNLERFLADRERMVERGLIKP